MYAVLIWSTTIVAVNGATFRPDHIVLLDTGRHPVVSQAVIDVNDTCNYDRCTAALMTSTSQITAVTNASSQSTSDDKSRALAVVCGPVRSSWSFFAAL